MPFQKGNNYGGSRGKKNHTLLSEKMRASFIKAAYKVWPQLTKMEMAEALTDSKVRHYVIDQSVGRAQERQKLEADIELTLDF